MANNAIVAESTTDKLTLQIYKLKDGRILQVSDHLWKSTGKITHKETIVDKLEYLLIG